MSYSQTEIAQIIIIYDCFERIEEKTGIKN